MELALGIISPIGSPVRDGRFEIIIVNSSVIVTDLKIEERRKTVKTRPRLGAYHEVQLPRSGVSVYFNMKLKDYDFLISRKDYESSEFILEIPSENFVRMGRIVSSDFSAGSILDDSFCSVEILCL